MGADIERAVRRPWGAENVGEVERLRDDRVGVAFREPTLPIRLHAVGPVEVAQRNGIEPLAEGLEIAVIDEVDAIAAVVEDRMAGSGTQAIRRERIRAGRESERLPCRIHEADIPVGDAGRVKAGARSSIEVWHPGSAQLIDDRHWIPDLLERSRGRRGLESALVDEIPAGDAPQAVALRELDDAGHVAP